GAVVQQIDDGPDAELGEPGHHLVQPGPVPLAGGRVDAVPGDTPAHELRPHVGGEAEVGVPLVVVLGELVLIERAFAVAGLRNERVLHADAEVQSAVLIPGHRVLTMSLGSRAGWGFVTAPGSTSVGAEVW